MGGPLAGALEVQVLGEGDSVRTVNAGLSPAGLGLLSVVPETGLRQWS